MKKISLTLGPILSILTLWVTFVIAEEPFQKDVTEWGLSGGFGDNFHINKNVDEDIEFFFLTPSWGRIIKKYSGSRSLEFVLEGFLSYVREDSKDRYAVGSTPLFLYNFKNFKRTFPFLELGIGILYTDLNPEGFGSNFNFTPQAGIGIRYKIAHDRFMKFSYRYHHISNAGTDKNNRSIDSNFFIMGISFFR